jgi:TDG/mug DNA glycosylase family protein
MGELLGFDPAMPYGRRLGELTGAGIALWDVLRSCEHEGSLDASIVETTEVPNDFAAFLERHSHIRAIAFNGQKAAKSFEKRVTLSTPLRDRLDLLRLPSTSAANARYSHTVLAEEWGALLRFLDHRDRSPTPRSP